MNNQNSSNSKVLVDLPELQKTFELLKNGRHISQSDGQIYYQLNDNFDSYKVLFEQLGFNLIKHRRDFYYFHSQNNNMSTRSQKMAVFMFILIEYLADNGHNIEEALMNQQFAYNQLPHLINARYRDILGQLGVAVEDDLISIVREMSNHGFAECANDYSFAFKSPVYRFLDICQEFAVRQNSDDLENEEQV